MKRLRLRFRAAGFKKVDSSACWRSIGAGQAACAGTDEQPHGGFVALTDGVNSTSTFLHAPDGVLPPVRSGGPPANCDGKGLDSIEECFRGQPRAPRGAAAC